MTRTAALIVGIGLIAGLYSCSTTSEVAGSYYTNFASFGMFGTRVKLMPDSLFEYVFHGDLLYDSATGHYKIYDKKVFMLFNKAPQSLLPLHDLSLDPIKSIKAGQDSIRYQVFFYIGHNKLFAANAENGKKITKNIRYNKRRKFIFFGSHFYKRRWYLQRK